MVCPAVDLEQAGRGLARAGSLDPGHCRGVRL